MKQWTKCISVIILSLLLCWTGSENVRVMAQAASEEPTVSTEGLRVDILWGDSSLVRIGRDIPITVRVSSTSVELTGTARVTVPLGNGDYYLLEEAVSVAPGRSRQITLSVPMTYDMETIHVEFQGDDGVVYGSRQIRFRTAYGDQEVYVAVISSDVGQLASFDRVVLNEYRGTTTRLFDFKEDTLPTNVNVLKLYDIFLWDDVDQNQIREEQREAMSSWVYGGGILIIGADRDGQLTVGDTPIRRESWGRGLYVYCDFSLRDILVNYPQEDGVRQFLYEAIGESRMTAIEETMEDTYGDYWSASSMTSGVDAGRIPKVWQFALVLMIYLVLLGPVLYGILKKKKRRNLLRAGMVGLALFFTGIIYIMGSRTRFYRPCMNYASVREIRDGMMVETVYAHLFSPFNSSYTMELDAGYDVVPLTSYAYEETSSTKDEICQLKIRKEEEKTQVWIRENVPFIGKMFRLTDTTASPYGDGFVGQITLFENGWEGVLQNATGQDFERVCVLAGGRVVFVGDMAAGAQVDLAQLPTWLFHSFGQNDILETLAGTDVYPTPGASEDASLATWRYRVLSSYFQNQRMDEQETALVMAFPAAEEGRYLVGNAIDGKGITLVTEVISIKNQKQGQHYRTMSRESIHVLQGNYNHSHNSITEALCVLRYDFGDLEVDRLLVQWTEVSDQDTYRKLFDQPLEFYNWMTGQYEAVGRKSQYNRQELAPYLDADNGLTVRYATDVLEELYYEWFLPELSVVGREVR